MKSILCTALLAFALARAQAGPTGENIVLTENDFQPGAQMDLSGQWYYKPGYAIGEKEKPELEFDRAGFVPVEVPQFLSRVYWWLDDSEDFKRHEDERLKRLGFDTDRAEDGWYQLQLNAPAIPRGRRLYLEFEGVAMKCKVYCNGQFLGDHKGMFSRFSFDLTDHLRDGANIISVFDSMEKIPPSTFSMGEAVTVNLTASKVKTMSKGMYGPLWPGADNRSYDLHGIWQPVRLVARGEGRIDNVWFIPSLDGGNLQITSSASQTNGNRLKAKWTDARSGQELAELDAPQIQSPNSNSVQLLHLENAHPKLWTPAEPNLYRLQVTLEDSGGAVLDSWNGKVGFRTFEIRGNRFFLNGHPWWLRGADHLPYGKNPWDPDLPGKLIQLLHDANLNVTRTHGTPWNEKWLDAADEIGLGVSIEGIRPWALAGRVKWPPGGETQHGASLLQSFPRDNGLTPQAIFRQWLTENQDVVERCRNHPSVLIYTVGNEMMLKDPKNLQKWMQLSTVVKQTRKIDPTRPVIVSSEYERDPVFYKKSLKPHGLDDGDIDDMHRYNNWYTPSSFVTDSLFKSEMKRNLGTRPLMGQEMSTGYPDLDTGLPVSRYTRDLLTPQAWVGLDAYPGSDPAVFLEHDRAVTKRWAEQLRFQRGTNSAGFMLFAAECWFSHSYDAKTLAPYPVYEAMREADAPIGLAWETGRRRFYGGEKIKTAVFISNDDDKFRDFRNLRLEVDFSDGSSVALTNIASLPYGKTIRVPVTVTFPASQAAREKMQLTLHLMRGPELISETTDPVELFKRPTRNIAVSATVRGFSLGSGLKKLLPFGFTESPLSGATVILIGSNAPLSLLNPTNSVRRQIENGATAIVFSPGPKIVKMFPDAIRDSKKVVAEYADFSPAAGTTLARGLQAMDLKWWGRTNDWRMYIASRAQQLVTNGPARELIRYIPSHGYMALDKLPEQYWTVMWELGLGKGRLWICDFDLEACGGVDPAARLFAENIFRAAADPDSTRHLPKLLTHEELMRGRTPP